MKALRTPAFCLVLFLISLWLRLPGLDTFLTADEATWAAGSLQVVKALDARDWAATNVSGHPAVTTIWAGVLGLAGRWLLAHPAGAGSLAEYADALVPNPVPPDLLPWLRFPVALVCAAGVVLIYLLARRLFREPVAMLGATLVALDPFLLAHGRVLALDAFLATFTTIAWLAAVVATRTRRRRYFVLSGAALGLAVLTKSPGLVLGPLLLAWILFTRVAAARRNSEGASWAAREAVLDLGSLGLPALVVTFAVWPALWAAPAATLAEVWRLMTFYGQEAHELSNFWLGQPAGEPGRLFYPAILLWRTTLITLPGFLLGLGWAAVVAWRALRGRSVSSARRPGFPYGASERPGVLALVLFIAWYGLILSLGDKKFDRYVLPLFPSVDLLAGWGWWTTLVWLAASLKLVPPRGDRPAHARPTGVRTLNRGKTALLLAALLLMAGQAASALANRPTYFTAYNPLAGGIGTAHRVFVVGWGEGLAEAAGYLNERGDAANSVAASWYGKNVFGPFYRGQSYDLYYDARTASDLYARDVDYVVTYVNQEQRDLLDPSVREKLDAPLFVSEEGDVTLAQVFAWPKPFAHTTDRRLSGGLALLGWDVGAYEPDTGVLPVTTYWDAAGLEGSPDADPRIVTWMKDAGGEVWAKAEAALDPAGRTEGWLDRPALAQKIHLRAPPGLTPGEYRVEVAPFAGEATSLGVVAVAAARLAPVLRSAGQPVAGVVLGDEAVFGDAYRLAGYTVTPNGQDLEIDLLWQALKPSEAGLSVFVHVVDRQDRIVTQQDRPQPGQDEGSRPRLQAGDLARQRVRLELPGGSVDGDYRVLAGIYRTADQQRLPLCVAGAPIPDGRYELSQTARQ